MFASALSRVVMQYKIHPILVNFTAALVPTSVFSDALGEWTGKDSLTETGRWTILYAAAITPLTALSGWLFWMQDDVGVRGMAIHKWLGLALALLIPGLVLWRWRFRAGRRPDVLYLMVGALLVAVLIFQGSLGGAQVFKDM